MKQQKGITLIALVITIIVLLILAGVSIGMALGENGILTRAENAKKKTEIKTLEEELKLKYTYSNMSLVLNEMGDESVFEDVEELGTAQDENGQYLIVQYKNNKFKVYYKEETQEVYDVIYMELKELDIYTCEEMRAFGQRVNEGENFSEYIVRLKNDLDFENTEWETIGKLPDRYGTNPTFAGVFDGENHTISGIAISENDRNENAIFGSNEGEIKNLKVKNGNIDVIADWHSQTAAICANNGGIIRNCEADIDISVDVQDTLHYSYIGGICGSNSGIIENCKNYGDIFAKGKTIYVGGVAATNDNILTKTYNYGKISSECYGNVANLGGITAINYSFLEKSVNEGFVTGDAYFTGGICGDNRDMLKECVNKGDVSTTCTAGFSEWPYVATILAYNKEGATVENCYNTGNILYEEGTTWSTASGLIARCGSNQTIRNCYTIADVPFINSDSNGVDSIAAIGDRVEGNISNCYYNIDIFPEEGIIATGYSTEYMKKAEFLELLGDGYKEDKENVNDGYPILAWE